MKSINKPHHQNAHSTIIAVGILTVQKTSFRKITFFGKEKGARWLLGILKNRTPSQRCPVKNRFQFLVDETILSLFKHLVNYFIFYLTLKNSQYVE